jgi:hypothetical protein
MASPLLNLIGGLKDELDRSSARLASGQINAAAFHNQVLGQLADYHTAAYLSGTAERLGVQQGGALVSQQRLNRAERSDITRAVSGQSDYLHRFTNRIEAGDLSNAQIRARAAQYAQSLRTTYSQAMTFGADLPFQPGDGGTACGIHCRCSWEKRGGAWAWVLDPIADHCDDCRIRADGSPYEGS